MSCSMERRGHYTLCTYTGPMCAREIEALTGKLLAFCRASGERYLLVDITGSVGEMTIFERYEHAVRTASILPRGARVAVLARSDQALDDRFWETVMLNRCATAGVFTEMDAALRWLLPDD